MSDDDIVQNLILDEETKEQLKALVLERINVMPDSLRLVVGSTEVSKDSILRHVEDEDEIGQQMMEMELEYLRDLASGAVYSL